MTHMLEWLRRLIDEPSDFSLDALLARDRAPAERSAASREGIALDLARLEARLPAAG